MTRDQQILWDALRAPRGDSLLERLSLASIAGMASRDPANVPVIEAALEQNRMDRDDELDWLGERGLARLVRPAADRTLEKVNRSAP